MRKKKLSIGSAIVLAAIIGVVGFKAPSMFEVGTSAGTTTVTPAPTSSAAPATTYSTGKATIPFYFYNENTDSSIAFSNITDNPIDVTITFYDNAGNLITDDNNISTGLITGTSELTNYCDQNTNSTITCTLAAHSTGFLLLNRPFQNNTSYGYGIISWKQNGTQLQGLTAWGCGHDVNGVSWDVQINGGLPF